MKFVFLKFSIMCLLLLVTNILLAQKDEENITPYSQFVKYSDPCAPAFAPVPIPNGDANLEAVKNSSSTGFSYAHFSKSEMTIMLAPQNCVGVRFYNAKKKSYYGIIAVGITVDGTEIGPYFFSQPERNNIISSDLIDKNKASSYVENLKNAGLTSYSVFYPKSSLNTIINSEHCIGIKLMPASRKFDTGGNNVASFKTMTVGGVLSNLGFYSSNCLKSQEPCPTVCPNDNLMLTPQK